MSEWERRMQYVLAGMEEMMGMKIPNTQDAVCNVFCNRCGRIGIGTYREPPAGWLLGQLGEDADYCPDCRGDK